MAKEHSSNRPDPELRRRLEFLKKREQENLAEQEAQQRIVEETPRLKDQQRRNRQQQVVRSSRRAQRPVASRPNVYHSAVKRKTHPNQDLMTQQVLCFFLVSLFVLVLWWALRQIN
jgi:hypothetical protein